MSTPHAATTHDLTVAGVTTTLEYDSEDRLVALIEGNGQMVTQYLYNEVGECYAAVTPSGDLAESIEDGTRRTYDGRGNLIEERLANGLTLTSTYDSQGRKISLTLPDQSTIKFHYDDYELVAIERPHCTAPTPRPIAVDHDYTTDYLGQIIHDGQHIYTYDERFNRTSIDGHPISYNDLDQPTHLPHDANGCLLTDGEHQFTYDVRGRLIECDGITYTYDNCDRLMTRNGVPFLWDNDIFLGPLNALNLIWVLELDGTPFLIQRDYTNRILSLSTLENDIVEQYDHTTFAPPQTSNPWAFGYWQDPDTGLIHFPKRVYHPQLGRFLTRDPCRQQPNPYTYCFNNPHEIIDPTGGFALCFVIPLFAGPVGWAAIAGGIVVGVAVPFAVKKANQSINNLRDQRRGPRTNYSSNGFITYPDYDSNDWLDDLGNIYLSDSDLPRPPGIPDDWIVKPSKDNNGTRYINPNNKNDSVRVMKGKPHSMRDSQRKPYVVRQRDGKFFDGYGNEVPKQSPEAHIPVEEFRFAPRSG